MCLYQGEDILRTEDIVAKIIEEGDSIALVYIPGEVLKQIHHLVCFRGQLFCKL